MILRNIIIGSVILNAGLIINVVGWMPFFLYVSLIMNAVLVWYVLRLTSLTDEFREDISTVFASIVNLENHIGQIYELEMFYGDETLEGLLNHTKSVADHLNFYHDKYNSPDEETEEDIEEDLEEITEEELDA